jgi:hypothetical protein
MAQSLETVAFLTVMIAELESLAAEAGVAHTAHFLRMALLEADRQASEGDEPWPTQSPPIT